MGYRFQYPDATWSQLKLKVAVFSKYLAIFLFFSFCAILYWNDCKQRGNNLSTPCSLFPQRACQNKDKNTWLNFWMKTGNLARIGLHKQLLTGSYVLAKCRARYLARRPCKYIVDRDNTFVPHVTFQLRSNPM